MRTTLTLDDDVAARIERLRQSGDESFKDLVNDLLRRGLNDRERPREEREPYRIRPHAAGRCFAPSLDCLHDALVIAEGEAYK